MKTRAIRFILLFVLVAAVYSAHASEMRQFRPIRTPEEVAALLPDLPMDARVVEQILPVDRRLVTETILRFAATWNTPAVLELLDEDFFDKQLFWESMTNTTKVPPDAKLRLLAIQDVHTLQQVTATDTLHGPVLVSVVLVSARTQVEFNDPDLGFVRLPGTNDFILQVKEKFE